MSQTPPPGFIPPPPGFVPPPPASPTNYKPLLIGCGALLAIVLLIGGVSMWFAFRAVSSAVHTATDAAQVAKGAVAGAQQAVEQAGSSPDPEHAAQAGAAVIKSLIGGGKGHAETLPREELKTYLPASLGSFARSNSASSKGSFAGISGTTASADYSDGTNSINVEVTDAVNMTGLTALMDLAMNAVESEDDSGYEKTVPLGDIKVHEKWRNSGKHSELIGIVGGRFAVEVTANGVEMSAAEQAFQGVDIAKLSAVAAATK